MIAVYVITDEQTGEQYIGGSCDVLFRMKTHAHQLQRGKHPIKAMQEAWDRDGAKAFTFRTLEAVANSNNLYDREQHWIHELKPAFNRRHPRDMPKARALASGVALRGDELLA